MGRIFIGRILDLTGHKYGKLTVLHFDESKCPKRSAYWICKCECGKIVSKKTVMLRTKKTKSCGCSSWKNPRYTHGRSMDAIYCAYKGMKARCSNPKHQDYKYYGGKGIKVCKRWMKFENFLLDMGERPTGKTLDRIDSNSDYCAENCRWATPKEQVKNRSCATSITIFGENITLTEAVDKYSTLSYNNVYQRLYKGWSIEDALYKPKKNDKTN